MLSVLALIDKIFEIYIFFLIVSAIMSWLVMFNVINPHNRLVNMIGEFLFRITEPALAPIRRVLPNLGGVDLSPVVLILTLIYLVQPAIHWVFGLLLR